MPRPHRHVDVQRVVTESVNPGGDFEAALIVEQGFNIKRGQEEAFKTGPKGPIGAEYSFTVLRPLVGAVIWEIS